MSVTRNLSPVTLERLPGWVVDNATSVRQEVAPYVDATAAERWAATRQCCRAALTVLRYHFDPSRALAFVDPVPESTHRALERLRRAEPRA